MFDRGNWHNTHPCEIQTRKDGAPAVLYGTARGNHIMGESCQFRIVVLVSLNLLGALL